MAYPAKVRLSFVLKLLLMASAIATLIVLTKQIDLQGVLQSALTWVDSLGTWGAIAFIGIYILAAVLFIPGSLITLGGGAMFGVVLGSLYVFVGAAIGATLAFLIGRYLIRGWVSRQIEGNAKFSVIDRAIAEEGFKIVALTRLSPIFPFNLLNYALGVTQVSLSDYILGFVGMIPGTVMYVYLGSLAGDLATLGTQPANSETQMVQWIIRIIGLVATIAVTLYVTHIAKQALDQRVASGDPTHDSVRDR
jgi:uncharacterized membrane protein YdjX (TVP38/TMEM64 family)